MDISLLNKVTSHQWDIPKTGDMSVPGRIFASRGLVDQMDEKVKEQISNVACLPGIQKASLAMPDAHWGYGFPIGGVGAFDPDEGGVICMGGIGFDISCGVRTMRTGLTRDHIQKELHRLADALFEKVPAGLGSKGDISLRGNEIDNVLTGGALWAVEQGYGLKEDLEFVEEGGRVAGADPAAVSEKAKNRQFRQVGTLGSGNHYLELQYVEEVMDEAAAKGLGIAKDDVVVSLHCGSRALGHQIGSDYLKDLAMAARKYNIRMKDRELACAPIQSPEGERYFSAVMAGINCALANRQAIAHLVRGVFHDTFPEAEVTMLYDISHNTCKVEEHRVEGEKKSLYVHRKGATRAFGPGRKEIPKDYRNIGQPVLIGGTMGTSSYILVGTETGTEQAFGSACHGAGRSMSRKKAKNEWYGMDVVKDLASRGIIVKAHSFAGVAEEAPGAYKDVSQVVDAVEHAGLARKVVRLRPMASIKG